MKIHSILSIALLLSILPTCGMAQPEKFRNKDLSVEERVNDLLGRMTIEEKINLLGGTGFATKPIERLGIPELRMTDGPLGVRGEKSTAFPSGICIGATWNPALAYNVGAAIGREVKGHDRHVILGPCVNIARIPQGGRNFESYGEDPCLTSRMAVDYIKGVQSEGVAATVKHFACNNQEYERMFVDTKVNERALNEIYFPAFKAAVQEANVLCVMNSYNKVNGHHASENDALLIDKLKKEWGFKWLVMSDWGAVHSTVPTANGGMDLEMPTGEFLNNSTLANPLKNGVVKETTIDDKVRRILRVIFTLGLFEKPSLKDESLIGSLDNRKAAFEAAKEGIVLLQNKENILPLDFSKLKSIAIIGPNAAICRTGGGGSSQVDPLEAPSPLEILKKQFGDKIKINYALGLQLGGEGLPIESKYLVTNKGEPGLVGEYFKNMELKGKPAFVRIDTMINFDFGNSGLNAGFPHNDFSVRWTGKLKAPETNTYLLETISDDGVRLWVDDTLLIDYWNDHAPEPSSVRVKFEASKEYKIKIEYYQHRGSAILKLGWLTSDYDPMKSALAAAKNSDAAILFMGDAPNIESEGIDRDNLVLPRNQDGLIEEVAKVNKNTIVVLNTGSPVFMDRWLGSVKAVVQAWFGGQEMSYAVSEVLSGSYNPSGKLPMTFPKRWEDCSAFGTYKAKDSVTEYSDGIYVGYRHFDKKNIEPLFSFGYGLSYTTFEYKDLKTETSANVTQPEIKGSLNVSNTGKCDGAEVIQVYVHNIKSTVDRPVKELKAFFKVPLKPGETKNVHFSLDKNAFSYYNVEKKEWIVEPGKYAVQIGSSSKDIRLSEIIELK
ncbi:MAG: glycoside hydrolase family 3 C-terminal domain-containing protein [Ignavibacteriales bacterium]|nr:glycoside hydrolase family 3 C-terminal domain-containing protein [Ignavibacteriales bacterium]